MYVLWDGWTRLFHWLLVLCVLLSWVSYEEDYLQVHIYSGYVVLILVLTRLVWGFVGSVHSRFSDFVVSPQSAFKYLLSVRPGGVGKKMVGHNPAGGWSVLVLLGLLLVQTLTGLFNSDELIYNGPFYHALDSSWTDKLGELHETVFWVLVGFIGLHIAAVALYSWVHKAGVVLPMITGGDTGTAPPQPLWKALLIAAVWAGVLYVAIQYAPQPEVYW